jgi:hypothetical protein
MRSIIAALALLAVGLTQVPSASAGPIDDVMTVDGPGL